jgi:hypothetical protein
MRDLVGNGIADTPTRAIRVEFDSSSSISRWHSASITNVCASHGLELEEIRKRKRVEWRAIPARVERTQHESACPVRYHTDRIIAMALVQKSYNRRVRPPPDRRIDAMHGTRR